MESNIQPSEPPVAAPARSQSLAVPPAVKGLSLTSLFNDFASEMVYPLLPAFVTGTLGGGAVTLGALDGAAELTAAVVKWLSGALSDRAGWRKPLILVGYATAVLVRPLISVTQAAWQVIGFRVIDRVGKGLRTPPRDALIADLTPAEAHGRAYGFHRGADHFGAVLGSVVAWLLLQRGVAVRQVIGWSVVPGLVAFALLAVVLRTARPAARRRAVPAAAGAAQGMPAGRVFWWPVIALAALTCFRLPETLLLLRLQDRGVPVAAIPLVWAALHVVRSAGSYPGGWLSDRIGPRRVVAAGGLLFALVAVLLALGNGPAAAIAAFMVFGLVAGLTESSERSVVARLAPARLGRGFGAYHALVGATALPAGIGFGWLYQHVSGAVALLASAVGVVVAVIVWLGVRPARLAAIAAIATAAVAVPGAAAQVQIRLAQPGRANYSELHEGLREGTRAADSVRRILRVRDTRKLWSYVTAVINGTGSWNDALLATTRIAELRDPRAADSALALRRFLDTAGPFPFERNPGLKAEDFEPSLQAIMLERQRATSGDSAVLADVLARIPTRRYDHGDAWVLGRLGAGASDSVRARFLAATNDEFRVRYLTLLSYFTDPALIPLLARVYAAPDSFGVPKRYAVRASDGLLWIGTRNAMQALLDARSRARERGVYADSSLWHGGYDFLTNDSAAVVARTGRWLTDWIDRLR